MRALDVFSISIMFMKRKIVEELTQRFTSHISENDIDFVLTVPAILGDAGKMFMRQAAVIVRF